MVKVIINNLCLGLFLASLFNCSLKQKEGLLDRFNSLGIEYKSEVINISSTDSVSKLIFHDDQLVKDFWHTEIRELFSVCDYGIPTEDDIQVRFKYAGRINISKAFESHLINVQFSSLDDAVVAHDCYLFTFKNEKVVSCLNVATSSVVDGTLVSTKSLLVGSIISLISMADDLSQNRTHYEIDPKGHILLAQ